MQEPLGAAKVQLDPLVRLMVMVPVGVPEPGLFAVTDALTPTACP